MDPETTEKVGLLRHKIISPVLMDSGSSQMSYFKRLEGQEFFVPGKGMKRFRATTMKGWLNRYRKNGFKALVPKKRTDKGSYRKISVKDQEKIMKLRQEHANLPVTVFYERWCE